MSKADMTAPTDDTYLSRLVERAMKHSAALQAELTQYDIAPANESEQSTLTLAAEVRRLTAALAASRQRCAGMESALREIIEAYDLPLYGDDHWTDNIGDPIERARLALATKDAPK